MILRARMSRSPAGRALRWAVHRLIVPLPPVQSRLARDYSGIPAAVTYLLYRGAR